MKVVLKAEHIAYMEVLFIFPGFQQSLPWRI